VARWRKGEEQVAHLIAQRHLRPTTTSGHIAVVDVIRAQFPGAPGLASLDRLSRHRNQA
jgi:hypothetical protein